MREGELADWVAAPGKESRRRWCAAEAGSADHGLLFAVQLIVEGDAVVVGIGKCWTLVVLELGWGWSELGWM